MQPAVGCDVCAVRDVVESIEAFGDRYLNRVFTATEVSQCAGSPERLAARFAVKEAVVKLFGDPELALPFDEVETLTDNGAPHLRLQGSIARRAAARGWQHFDVSISHAECHALAVVIAF